MRHTPRLLTLVLCLVTLATACSITDVERTSTTRSETAAPITLTLYPEALGDVRFGATPEATIVAFTPAIGAPDGDTGWIDGTTGIYGRCPAEVRVISWGSLAVFFTMSAGFFAFSYGFDFDDATAGVDPRSLELATATEIGLGTTVAELAEREPQSAIEGDPAIDVWSFSIGPTGEAHLRGTLTGPDPDDRILVIETSGGCQ